MWRLPILDVLCGPGEQRFELCPNRVCLAIEPFSLIQLRYGRINSAGIAFFQSIDRRHLARAKGAVVRVKNCGLSISRGQL